MDTFTKTTGLIESNVIRTIPKVVLHEHLDGGVRPEMILSLAAERSINLPAATPATLADWFHETASSGTLEGYLSTFDTVTAVMQDAEALGRIAEDYVTDLLADGVIYAELRFAPERHVKQGLTMPQVVAAVASGIERGIATSGGAIEVSLILCAVRNFDNSEAVARLVTDDLTGRVVAFDLAGGEEGCPPSEHDTALTLIRDRGRAFTIHAGEIPSLSSLHEAMITYGAHRIGHGVVIVNDSIDGKPGELLRYAIDHNIPFEVCPLSNVQTGVCGALQEHPFDKMRSLGLNVSINTDNRLMSRTTVTHEMACVATAFGYDLEDLLNFSRQAVRAVFASDVRRAELVNRIDTWASDEN